MYLQVCRSGPSQTQDVDTSVEAVRGSPCGSSDETLVYSPDVSSRPRPACRRCRPDAAETAKPVHRSHHGRCANADCVSKSGGSGTRTMAREAARCDLRRMFERSRLAGDIRCEAVTGRDLVGVCPPPNCRRYGSAVVCQSQRQCQQSSRRSRSRRCVDVNHDTRRSVLPPGELNRNVIKRDERHFDRVRKRTLVNRFKQFSGCFCDTGCGSRMRTLANI